MTATPDPLTTKLGYHHADETLLVERSQDVEPILDANKADYDPDNKRYGGESFYRVASIPLIVIEQWMNEGVNIFDPDHKDAIRRKLNDRSNLFLRTRPGRI